MKGLEPLLREKLDPKSSASTNSATPAILSLQRYNFFGNAELLIMKGTLHSSFSIPHQFLTSSASRRALPMSINAKTKSMMAIPGKMAK